MRLFAKSCCLFAVLYAAVLGQTVAANWLSVADLVPFLPALWLMLVIRCSNSWESLAWGLVAGLLLDGVSTERLGWETLFAGGATVLGLSLRENWWPRSPVRWAVWLSVVTGVWCGGRQAVAHWWLSGAAASDWTAVVEHVAGQALWTALLYLVLSLSREVLWQAAQRLVQDHTGDDHDRPLAAPQGWKRAAG